MLLLFSIFMKAFYSNLKFCDSFNEQGQDENNLGNSVDEVYQNLINIGVLNKIQFDETDIYKVYKIHNVLVKLYNGTYPLYGIMDGVRTHQLQFSSQIFLTLSTLH